MPDERYVIDVLVFIFCHDQPYVSLDVLDKSEFYIFFWTFPKIINFNAVYFSECALNK